MDMRMVKYIGCCNVCTMRETARVYQVARELARNKIEILGLSGVQWKGNGKLKLSSGETFLYSENEEEEAIHTSGVGFMPGKEASHVLMDWEGVSDTLIVACFETRFWNTTIINAYAAYTNDKEIQLKEQFYKQQQEIYDKIQNKYRRHYIGRRYECHNRCWPFGKETVTGKEGVGIRN